MSPSTPHAPAETPPDRALTRVPRATAIANASSLAPRADTPDAVNAGHSGDRSRPALTTGGAVNAGHSGRSAAPRVGGDICDGAPHAAPMRRSCCTPARLIAHPRVVPFTRPL